MINDKKSILFINGEIELKFCEKYIKKRYPKLPIYCADGAFNKISKSKVLLSNVKKVIGDRDSVVVDKDFIKGNYIYIKEQETTDFEKCLNYLRFLGYSKVMIFGAGGGELDHTINNISILSKNANLLKLILIDSYSVAFFLRKNQLIKGCKRKMISIIPLMKVKKLNLEGCKYTLNNENLTFGRVNSIRNYAVSDTVKISYEIGEAIIFISHKKYKEKG